MNAQFNSVEKKEAMSKELSSLRLKKFRSSTKTETQALDDYLANFDTLHEMSLTSDCTPGSTKRILQTEFTPSPWLKFALNKMTRPFQPHTMRTAFYNAIHIMDENEADEDNQPSLTLYKSANDTLGNTCTDTQEIVIQYPNGEQNLFTGQRRLGRQPNKTHRPTHHARPSSNYQNSSHTDRPQQFCFNCERPQCTVKRCPQKKDFSRIRRIHHR